MAFEKKNAYTRKTTLGASDFEDDIPVLPESFTGKFTELEEYNRQMQEFWASIKTSLVRMEDSINNLDNQQIELEKRVTALEKFHP